MDSLHEHVNLLGRYQFLLPERLRRGGLRSLRDPDVLEDNRPFGAAP